MKKIIASIIVMFFVSSTFLPQINQSSKRALSFQKLQLLSFYPSMKLGVRMSGSLILVNPIALPFVCPKGVHGQTLVQL